MFVVSVLLHFRNNNSHLWAGKCCIQNVNLSSEIRYFAIALKLSAT